MPAPLCNRPGELLEKCSACKRKKCCARSLCRACREEVGDDGPVGACGVCRARRSTTFGMCSMCTAVLDSAGPNWVKTARKCEFCNKSRLLAVADDGAIGCPECLVVLGVEEFRPVSR